MPGSFEGAQPDTTKLQNVAIRQRREGVFRLGSRAQIDLCSGAVPQFEVTRQEIGVKVSEEDMANLSTVRFGVCQVLVHVSLRVDDGGSPAVFVHDQIGSVSQTTQIVLF